MIPEAINITWKNVFYYTKLFNDINIPIIIKTTSNKKIVQQEKCSYNFLCVNSIMHEAEY